MPPIRLPAAAAALLVGISFPQLAAEEMSARLRYGRYLASECSGCHRTTEGGEAAIPSLAGRPAAEIAALLREYREHKKTNPVMVSVAQSLDEDETAAVAAYFASLPSPARSDALSR